MSEPLIFRDEKPIKRITLRKFLEDLIGLFDIDRGVLLTLRSLMLNPGDTVRNYIGKDRYLLSNPFRMVAVLSAIATLLATQFEYMQLFMAGLADGMGASTEADSEAARAIQESLYSMFYDYFNVITFLCLPFMALCTRAFYRRKELNYAEHLVINAYILAFTTLIFIIVGFLFLASKWEVWLYVYMFSSIGYQVFAYCSLFKGERLAWSILKAVIVVAAQYILFLIAFLIAFIIYLILNPELLNA